MAEKTIVGPSGVEATVDEAVASGLVNAGYAEYAKSAPSESVKSAPKKTSK